jgi:hypothetical protein
LINVRIVLDDLFGHMGEVEFDWPLATRLKVDEQRSVLRAEQVARVRLTVQQLFRGAAVGDRSSYASYSNVLLRSSRSASVSAGVRSRLATSC